MVLALSEILPRAGARAPLSPEALDFMAEGLADIPPERLHAAAIRARNSLRFFPTVAELRQFAGMPPEDPETLMVAESLAAWETVCAWCSRNAKRNVHSGIYEVPDHSRGALTPREDHALRIAGGINRFLMSRGTDELKWVKRDFIEAYRVEPLMDAAETASPAALRLAESLAKKLTLG